MQTIQTLATYRRSRFNFAKPKKKTTTTTKTTTTKRAIRLSVGWYIRENWLIACQFFALPVTVALNVNRCDNFKTVNAMQQKNFAHSLLFVFFTVPFWIYQSMSFFFIFAVALIFTYSRYSFFFIIKSVRFQYISFE